MTETELQRSILTALSRIGVWGFRVNSGRMTGLKGGYMHGAPNGTPDLCMPGLGWCEVKLPGEPLRPAQVEWHARARALGVKVWVWHSVEECLEDMREAGK